MDPDTRRRHDLLMAFQPSGADHGPHNCPVCAAAEDAGDEEGTLTTYSDEQVQEMIATATATATASLAAELADLKAATAAGQTDARIAAAVAEALAPVETERDEARQERDVATADLNARNLELKAIAEAAEAAEAAALEAAAVTERRDARVAQIAEVALFTDEQIAVRSSEWAAMDDAAFTTLVETLRSSAPATTNRVVRPSALTAAETPPSTGNLGAALALARTRGSAPRTLQN